MPLPKMDVMSSVLLSSSFRTDRAARLALDFDLPPPSLSTVKHESQLALLLLQPDADALGHPLEVCCTVSPFIVFVGILLALVA